MTFERSKPFKAKHVLVKLGDNRYDIADNLHGIMFHLSNELENAFWEINQVSVECLELTYIEPYDESGDDPLYYPWSVNDDRDTREYLSITAMLSDYGKIIREQDNVAYVLDISHPYTRENMDALCYGDAHKYLYRVLNGCVYFSDVTHCRPKGFLTDDAVSELFELANKEVSK